jgi:DNA polymerase-4
MSSKIIFHVDMDQFYAAVETLHNPHLRGKPVIVGGTPGGRGIVTTASYEARRYGVRSGMPSGEAYRLCPHAIFVRPDIHKYVDVSRRVFQLLREFTERVEPVSVDEAYMDVSDVVWAAGGVKTLAMRIKQRIREAEGLTATIGAGANRLVAKVACGMNKPDGFTYLPPERVAEVFRDLPVGKLYGIGKATQAVLEEFGIRTAGELATFPREVLRRRLGQWGEHLIEIARGHGRDDVLTAEDRPEEKSMGHEHTFGEDLTDRDQILGRLHLLCEKVGRRLRARAMAGRVVTLKLRYQGFETTLHGRKLKRHMQHEADIYSAATRLFEESYERGRAIRLVGVSVSDLISSSLLRQQELFLVPAEFTGMSRVCDRIKERFGDGSIGYASSVFHSGRRSGRPRKTESDYTRSVRYRPFYSR